MDQAVGKIMQFRVLLQEPWELTGTDGADFGVVVEEVVNLVFAFLVLDELSK